MMLANCSLKRMDVCIERMGSSERMPSAQFWQRMVDQSLALLLFTYLLALSILPILQLQTAILFNRAFAAILRRKIHKQELLDDLYTPGLFYKVEAQESEQPAGSTLGRTLRGARRGSVAVGKGIAAGMRRASLGGARRAAPPAAPLAQPEAGGKAKTKATVAV